MIRKPIITFLGHVDTGKTSLQDYIRQSTMTEREAGLITQHVGASTVPIETIKRISGPLLKTLKIDITIPGLLFIDTPGHEAFITLRKRGGNLADIAVVVIDINEGFKPQTFESIDILRQYKTPFIVAANKIDLINGYQSHEGSLIQRLDAQSANFKKGFDTKFYNLVSKFYEKYQMNAERFDKVNDYTKQIAIVPCSAKSGDGIPELLMMLTGLSQRFLKDELSCDVEGNAKGTVLEVKEEKGIGKSLDIIIYDGCLKKNDIIVIGGVDQPIVTKIRSLFEPKPLSDLRDKKTRFTPIDTVSAATGIKISAPDIEDVVPGMPLRSCIKKNLEKVKEEIQKEVEEVLIETDRNGIIIKADTLGSLEALIRLLREKDIPIRIAGVGNISKKDITEAESNSSEDPLHAVVLGFNVIDDSKICNDHVKVLTSNIIYKIIEELEKWQEEQKKSGEAKELDLLVKPAKIEVLKGYVFRQSNPAILGIEVLEGKIKTGMPLMNNQGKSITEVKEIQHKKDNISEAEKGMQVAVSMPGVVVGRQVKEGDILFSSIPEEHFKKLKGLKKYLGKEEIEILKEIAEIKRKDYPTWGV
ncbi:MAG: translation initiation factor IF-2 [Candidatus Woesearchaeota archaeon]